MVVSVKESFKSSSYNDGKEHEEQVRNHLVINEEAIKIFTESDGRIERFNKDERYTKREQRPPREWWKNHILPKHN